MPPSFNPAARFSRTQRIGAVFALFAGVLLATVATWAGVAMAASGGGYNTIQQGCQPGDDDYATPNGVTYPNCHSLAISVASGGTSQGDALPTDTKYVTYGNNQVPNDPKSVGTPTYYSIGLPGYTGDPHSGCLAVNTDGTGGGPAPAGTQPEAPGTAEQATGGCGNNPNGTGFESNYDYYQYFCPIAKMIGYTCEDTDPGVTTVTADKGSAVDLQPILQDGVLLYFGLDDNSDNGEHDGVGPYSALLDQNNNGVENGASDGGGATVSVTPQTATRTATAADPEGLANLSLGMCADGICSEGTTQQQTVYHGCDWIWANGQAPCDADTPTNANVYDYAPDGNPANDPSVNTENYNCSSSDQQSTSEAECGPGGMDALRSATPQNENTEPGLQIYSDPDSQRSPVLPEPLWPTPAAYVGTCGLYIGSAAITGHLLGSKPISLGDLTVTNADGQLAIDPDPKVC
jgi:hypothetical protein